MTTAHKTSSFQLIRRLLNFARPYWSGILLAAVMAIIMAPLSALLPYLTHIIVDDYIMKSDLKGLQLMSIYFIIILVLSTVIKYYFTILTNWIGQSVIKDLRVKVFKTILSFRLSYFDKTAVGTNTTRTINDLESINIVFSEGLITIVADILSLVMVLIAMFYTSVKLTFISLVSFPLLVLASYIFKEKVKDSFQRVRNEVARMNAFLQEHISGMKLVQIFTAERKTAERFKSINKEYTQANLDGIFYYAVFFPVVEIISAASLGFMIWWGAKGVISQDVTIGQLVAFPMFLNRLFQPVRMLADKFNTLQMGLIASQRVFQLLDAEETEPVKGNLVVEKLRGDIKFKEVDFEYNKGVPVLKKLSFEVKAGQSLAIVGNTGSGKTSIISTLSSLYPIQSGKIEIDGINIDQYDLSFLRSRMGTVLQDVFLFYGSIYDNISLKNDTISKSEIIEASKAIGAHDFIMNLPDGYEYIVSERGNNLSMGQRQLISFVRAWVYNPDILILDEATSSIDTHTEQIIQAAISRLIKGRTSIIIAHRLSTVRQADQILVLSNGEIKEKGTHEELLSQIDGLYYQLNQAQIQLAEF
ncbi:MAG: ABC transporter ATP-binding protein [Saprospiraceae bacterium]|nr:ABC transporter ATP-binding protein [Saprospiraceae bacterium]